MLGAVKRLVPAAALLVAGCTYGSEPAPDCIAHNLPYALQALPDIRVLSDPPPASLSTDFSLCSTHRDRLDAASAALGAQGYSHFLGSAEVGKCLRVTRSLEATPQAVERDISALCRIAGETRIRYMDWTMSVGGRSVFLHGDYFSIDGKVRMLGKENERRAREERRRQRDR
jgi:hypothetical protein